MIDSYYLVVLDCVRIKIYTLGSFTLHSDAEIAKEYFDKGIRVSQQDKEFYKRHTVRVIKREDIEKMRRDGWIR